MTLILGEDGKVHTGQLKMRGVLTDCRVPGLRPLSAGEKWWEKDPWRSCTACFATESPFPCLTCQQQAECRRLRVCVLDRDW